MILSILKWVMFGFGIIFAIAFLIDVIDSNEYGLGTVVAACMVIAAYLVFGIHTGTSVIGISGFIYYMTQE